MYNNFRPKHNQNRRFATKKLPNRELLEAIRAVEVTNSNRGSQVEEAYASKNGFSDFAIVPKLKENISAKK